MEQMSTEAAPAGASGNAAPVAPTAAATTNHEDVRNGGTGHGAEALLEGAIETLRQLSIIVEDYHPHQAPTFLYDKINGLIEDMSRVDRARHQHADVELPMQIFQFIDEGKNPDLYVQDSLLRRCLERNERTRGKLQLLQRLREEIAAGAAQLLPEGQDGERMVTDPPDRTG